jgi:hypothetical protein
VLATTPYRVSNGGSSRVKKHFPEREYEARNSTPVDVSLLTVVGVELGVTPSTQLTALSSAVSSAIVASAYRSLGSRALELV